jgi:hypothetical protein
MPKFATKYGLNVYYFELYPTPDSDRADRNYPIHKEVISIEHRRNEVIAQREVMDNRGVWVFIWENITLTQVQALQYYTEMDYFRFYPDGSQQVYFRVYCPEDSGWEVKTQRGGTYNVTMLIKQYTGVADSSSSSCSSSSSST